LTAPLLASFVAAYFLLLLAVAWRTSRGADNESFFIGNRRSHWALVAFGMVGTSLSGVTFISVPGAVGTTSWTYLQIVLGHLIGYVVVALVLLPLYYRLRVASIYHFLRVRLGPQSYRTGAGFFILSRTLGATARLYLVVRILQDMMLDSLGVPFWASALLIIVMIVLYTVQGGVKTIVWTDTLQTAGMLFGLVACTAFLLYALQVTPLVALDAMRGQGLATIFVSDPMSKTFWLKQIVAGAFITIAMTGLDQEMMQKNISVRTLAGAQKNMLVLSLVLLVVVLLFLYLGALLQFFALQDGVAARGDRLFPAVVMQHMPVAMQMIFVLALISALFPSADGALTALTSSFCIDILGMQQRAHWSEVQRQRVRRAVHLAFALSFLALVLGFRWLDDPSMIGLILKIAAYTYGPLLGLFAFGILTRRQVRDGWVPAVAVAAPLICAWIDAHQSALFGRYQIGLEMLLLNGALTFAGLWLLSRAPQLHSADQSARSVAR
jgi:Na+/proline symporter